MRYFRRKSVRKTTLLILFSWGVFTQVSIIYACQSEMGLKQIGCCCEHAYGNDCKCNGSNGDFTNLVDTEFTLSCCDISYGVADDSITCSRSDTALKVLLLDASQPPPMLPSYPTALISQCNSNVTYSHAPLLLSLSRSDTYLHTHRLRI